MGYYINEWANTLDHHGNNIEGLSYDGEIWIIDEHGIRLDGGYVKWCSEIEADLWAMSEQGVTGYITFYGEMGEWYRYILDGEGGMEEQEGVILFPAEKLEQTASAYEYGEKIKDIIMAMPDWHLEEMFNAYLEGRAQEDTVDELVERIDEVV